MTARGKGIRWGIYLVILVAATAWVFGCGHSNLGPYPEDEGGGTAVEPLSHPPRAEMALSAIRLHNVELAFLTPMETGTVQISVRDDRGEDFEPYQRRWREGNSILDIAGPYQYCRTYTFTLHPGAWDCYGNQIAEAVVVEVPIGANPNDLDKTASCTADRAISPIYSGGPDAMILKGDGAMDAGGLLEFSLSDLVTDRVWYQDATGSYDGAGRMILIPELGGEGTTGAAKLFWREEYDPVTHAPTGTAFELLVWDAYDPVDETPASVFTFWTPAGSGEWLTGPIDAGDLDGDGDREILLTRAVGSGSSRLQRVFLLAGPVAAGGAAPLSSAASVHLVGDAGAELFPPVPVGDINGDGYDDLAAMSREESSSGGARWKVLIWRGGPDLAALFGPSNRDSLRGTLGRDLFDIDGADLDGDGMKELVVADMQRKTFYGSPVYARARFTIVAGADRRYEDEYLETAGPHISLYQPYLNYSDTLNARALGDVNGDGFEDLGVSVSHTYQGGIYGSAAMYVILGRADPFSNKMLGPYESSPAALVVESDEVRKIVLRDEYWDSNVGDIDNDGHSDFMLKVSSADGFAYHLFPGAASISEERNRIVLLDEAPAAFGFIAP